MTPPLSERQQLKVLLQTTAPLPKISALNMPISPTQYLSWSTARRRAWDRRHSSPNSYFLHYLHPSLSPRPPKWSPEEHLTFLAALQRAPPSEQWGLFSLLVPGRIGSECRRYYHRIGRAGFITSDGNVRNRLLSKAKITDGKNVLKSNNPLFLRRSLRKFVPGSLPQIDDALYKSLEKPSPKKRAGNKASAGQRPCSVRDSVRDSEERKSLLNTQDSKPAKTLSPRSGSSEKLDLVSPARFLVPAVNVQDLLTYIPAKPSEYAGQPSSDHSQDNGSPSIAMGQENSEAIKCRLRLRQPNKRKDLSYPSLFEQEGRSNHSTDVVSDENSRRTGDDPVTVDSVKTKIRAKSPNPGDSSAKAPQTSMVARSKRKDSKKNQNMKKSNPKAMKNVKKEEKENHIEGQVKQSHRFDKPQASARTAEDIKVFQGSGKEGNVNICKKLSTTHFLMNLDNQANDDPIKLQEKSVKSLKPILKSRDGSKERGEFTKSVHFSQAISQGNEAAVLNDITLDTDVIPDQKSSVVVPVVFPHETPATSQVSIDGKRSSNHEINSKINKTIDKSQCTQQACISGTTPHTTQDSGTINHVKKCQTSVERSLSVSYGLDSGRTAPILSKEATPVEHDLCSPLVVSETPRLNESNRQAGLEFTAMPLVTEFDRRVNSLQTHRLTGKTTPEPFHAGSFAKDSEIFSLENKPEKHVEIKQPEHSPIGSNSPSTGTDGELLDIGTRIDTPPREGTEDIESLEETDEFETKLRNFRRVSGPTGEDRTSISFLMNETNVESPRKKRRREQSESSVERGKNSVSPRNSDGDEVATLKGYKNSCPGKGSTLVQADVAPKVKSEYEILQTKVEQTRLLLRLFIDMVEPRGDQLGHKLKRVKLLESFEESLRWVRDTEGQATKKRPVSVSNLFRAAQTAAELDSGRPGRIHHTIQVGGLTHHWGSFLDSYIDRLKDMETRQELEIEGMCRAENISGG